MNDGNGQLRSIVDRILRLHEDKDAVQTEIKDVYAEAKSNGFDKTALGVVVSRIRKRAKDAGKADELENLVAVYEAALGTGHATHTHERGAA